MSTVTLPIRDRQGNEVGTYEADLSEFATVMDGHVEINRQLLHDVVVMYLANRRQGTFRTKSRAEVAGTTKKMYRQKGSGNARMGQRRSPVRVGGGHAFAKRPRDFSYRHPKKMVRLATRQAFAGRIAERRVYLVDDLSFPAPKTREAASILKALKVDGKVLVLTASYDQNAYRSVRNISGATIMPILEVNAYELLRNHTIVTTAAALDAYRELVSRNGGTAAGVACGCDCQACASESEEVGEAAEGTE
ncbi:MAG: 50S ribosomal protein L4 [Planctomycetia bacterium]|nr:50S ribosomal protein L4 [Planctomycetia bacterium]